MKEKFIEYRNRVNYLIKINKQNYYTDKFANNIDNPKKFWQITNEILFNQNSSKNPKK